MDYTSLPLFSLMKAKLNHASERQAVLAQNIANADTPDYRAKDIEAPDFSRMVSQSAGRGTKLAVTQPGHMSPSATATPKFRIEDRKTTYDQTPISNNVAVEEEMMKVAQNQMEYQKVLNLYRKTVAMFKTAAGSSSGGG